MNIFAVLAIVALLATIVMLARGIASMIRGGEADEEASTWLMLRRVEFQGAAVALVLAAVLTGFGWFGAEAPQAEALDVHLGVQPAEELRQRYEPDSAEARAFGGIPDQSDAYLVSVALMDEESGQRIREADVSATVGRIGLSGTERQLQPAEFAGATTYGGYFRLRQAGTYRVELRVDRPDAPGTNRIRLEFHRP